jgi:hypothetical protein
LFRRFMMPALVVVVAAGLLLWGNQREARRVAAFERFGAEVCAALRRGEDPARAMTLADESLRGPLAAALAPLIGADGPVCAARVGTGPGPAAAQSAATHHVVLEIGGAAAIGLRVGRESEDGAVIVAGFWTPDAAAAP